MYIVHTIKEYLTLLKIGNLFYYETLSKGIKLKSVI